MGMHGYLIPASGGKAMALKKRRMFLGRAKGADRSSKLSEENAYCLLELIDGWWHIDDLRCPGGLKVNRVASKRVKLMPDDELVIGKYRFRISFEAPQYEPTKKKYVERKHRRDSQKLPVLSAPTPNGRLVPLAGGADFRLQEPTITIGRRPPCDIVISDKTVSGKHCQLSFLDGHWQAEDLGSRNGIRIDSKSCEVGWVLPGHRLSIGVVRFRIDYEGHGPAPYVDTVSNPGKSLLSNLGLSEQDFGNDSDDDRSRRKPHNLTDT